MKIRYNRKPGYLLLAAVTVIFVMRVVRVFTEGLQLDNILFAAAYLLAATMLHFQYVNVAIVTDERGLTVQRAGIPNLVYAWGELQVEQREKERRGQGGWLLERKGQDKPHFLPWKGLADEDITALNQEMQKRLEARG
ncbi:hypothetical protein [Tumebacillus permanentifrigoris]|uniref:PH (Pleckstrin Homology) domain-containing protein n=1 Tax=Tumebacillus permanentifrigoris TaxID=378543 RepID=A0A316DDB9_9BACL|nr:hypothetical protein [Tumebacillus permanentifrigoris]PWK15965.1 hypothetical protein C7459_102211 [Tumebacillus permanentifrigoris]